MTKLLSMIVAAMFAAVSVNAIAASHMAAKGDKMEKAEAKGVKKGTKKVEKKAMEKAAPAKKAKAMEKAAPAKKAKAMEKAEPAKK